MSAVLDKQLILVAGKGGVGRSTVAASIAAACARQGRRTLLYQANAKDRYGQLFRRPPVGTEVTRLAECLYAVNATPASALEEYGLMTLRFKRIYRMVFENRVTKYFLRAIPGLDDYAILGKAWWHTTGKAKPRFDTLVFDLPASGHSLSMLRIPWAITETVPEGPLTRDARSIKELLTDPRRTSLVLVTLAEEMPVNEAIELRAHLSEQIHIEISHLVVNMVYPELFPPEGPAAAVLEAVGEENVTGDLAAVVGHASLAASRRLLNREYLDQLAEAFECPRTELPMLFARNLGPEEVATLSECLVSDLA